VSGPYTALPLCGILGSSSCATDQSPDAGWAAFGAIGTRLDGSFRVEGEIGYRTSQLSSISDIDHLTAMVNLLYDFAIGDRFSVGIGGGLGLDRISWTGEDVFTGATSDDHWSFAVQGLLSASFKLSERTSLDLKYRYMVPMDVAMTRLVAIDGAGRNFQFTGDDVQTQTVSLGVTFALD